MSYYYSIPLVNEAELMQARAAIGVDLVRIIGYFREDGAKSIVLIEEALAAGDAAAMVLPAHTLKGESRQFGGNRLGDIAEVIEKTARRCLEQHIAPDEVASEVAMLRGCFVETLAVLDAAVPPVAHMHTPSGVRPATLGGAARTFGRKIG